ncbi:hypothetical protein [Corynebacterium bovis]|uniref:hypothetical protein n=1 Tax=Corynebacterium bovis TaxID=36808 RepID=UPI000F64D5E3|nr:hypothetical protein [Corynebacterium bovis]MDN8578292.1 hypothetical protein [Corynebacterium bovis]
MVLLDRAETTPGIRPVVADSPVPAGLERFNHLEVDRSQLDRAGRIVGRRVGLWMVLAAGLAMTVTPMVFSVLRLGATTGVSVPLVGAAAVVVGIIAALARRSAAGAGWSGPVAVGVGVAIAVWSLSLMMWAVMS